VYGTKLSLGLIELKLKEHAILSDCTLNMVEPGETVNLEKIKIEYIRNNLSLKKTPYSSFYYLNVRSPQKELSYRMATKATEIFYKRCMEVIGEEARRELSEIDKQLQIIRQNLETAEHDFRTFIDKTGQIEEGVTPELKTLMDAYTASLAQIGIKEADIAAEKKQLENLEAKIASQNNIKSPEYLQLRARLRELEAEKIRLEEMGIRLASISNIDREIREIEQQLLKYKKEEGTSDPIKLQQWQTLRKSVITKENELEVFKRRMEYYQKAIESYKKGKPDLLLKSLEYLRLKRSKEVYENLYTLLLEKSEEAKIKNASGSIGLKIVDWPRKPSLAIPKNEARIYLMGIILGLFLGCALAFMVEFNDTTIKSTEDIEQYIGLSVLGKNPHISFNKNNEVKVRRTSPRSNKEVVVTQYPAYLFDSDNSVSSEAYRSLRTNILFTSPDKPLKCIAITSATSSEGKSLTVSNLAISFAQLGKKTLLIDADLRRPVLHHIFRVKREPGLADLFIEQPSFDTIIRKGPIPNLSLLTAGIFTPNPAELLGSNKMGVLLDYFVKNYDMVLFDTSPLIAVTDATVLGIKTDGIIIVVKSGYTERELLKRGVNILKNVGIKIIGTVLNDIDLSHRYSSYGYYKYYYHYYKTQKD
ncbi:MAG: polysaccharide biosynthesis tyrosine autokinase, partial [Chitinispirillaceae bacterium]|nr:polysaccharide biosynthesis tyrosine autokinase [Chitinispirillaceae bacterium]